MVRKLLLLLLLLLVLVGAFVASGCRAPSLSLCAQPRPTWVCDAETRKGQSRG